MKRTLSQILMSRIENDGRLYPDDVEALSRGWGVDAEQIRGFERAYRPAATADRLLTDVEARQIRGLADALNA